MPASTDATRIATLARSWRSGASSNARPATNTDTVNPMPATALTLTTPGQPAPSGSAPSRSRVASQANAVMPTSLPATSPTTIPAPSGVVNASATLPALIGTPALARANSGTTTKLVHGWRRCSSHSTTDTESRASTTVCRAASYDDTSASSSASTSSGWRTGRVGAISPSTTPTRVAWMPDSWTASHSAAPTTVYGRNDRTPPHRSAATTPTSPNDSPSASRSIDPL
jgi:hypothetical protein